jgi:hypothetical protein
MPYDSDGLVCVENFIGVGANGIALKKYTYTTNDTKATVEGVGYFNAEAGRFKVGDVIEASMDIDGTPAGAHYVVGSNDGSVVGITAYVLGGSSTSAEIDRACDVSARIVNVTASTLALTEAAHDGKTITLNRAAGIALTLPAASGSGARFRLFVGTTITSNSITIKVANSSDTMVGAAVQAADGGSTANIFEAGGTDDTITFNGTTTGGIKGDWVELEDVAANLWRVNVFGSATGAEATPFSATV